MASAQARTTASRVVGGPTVAPTQCGATSDAHARLVSFARAQVSTTTSAKASFGIPSTIGAAQAPQPPAEAPNSYERAFKAVPKRSREPMSVEQLAGLFGGLRGPAVADDAQKRRRRAKHPPPPPPPHEPPQPVDADEHAEELCFLVDKCDIEDADKCAKFMPYIV